jgi:hypothetical protein
MKKNRIEASSIWLDLIKLGKQSFKLFQQNFRIFGSKYPALLQNIQLSFIYFFALIDLIYSILSVVFALNYFPEILKPFSYIISAILESPILKIWTSPEKVFFMSYVVIEFMIVKPVFQFSKLVRYNILLIFAILMLQGLMISYWDLLFNRQITASIQKWAFDEGAIIFTDKSLAIFFYFNTFILFLLSYSFLYIKAIQGKFATFPKMNWLTDSIAFWLRIKTTSMPYGKRKKK